jgi:hypothetical protein
VLIASPINLAHTARPEVFDDALVRNELRD